MKLSQDVPVVLREVLCHELAHFAVWYVHGRSARRHGLEWRELMELAGYTPRLAIISRCQIETID
jgi:predicted SprT family Zn-dependent metalloprotease